MSEPYAPDTTTAPTSPVTVLNDGDNVTFASLMQGIIEPLWNGVFYLLNNLSAEVLSAPWTWTGDQRWEGDNVHVGLETFEDEALLLRLNANLQSITTIAANTTLSATVGVVKITQPSTNTTYNVVLPDPVSGNPIVIIRFSGAIAAARTVYVTDPTNLAVANPADYYGVWGPASAAGGYILGWIGSRWEILNAYGGVSAGGGGTLA